MGNGNETRAGEYFYIFVFKDREIRGKGPGGETDRQR